MVETEGVIKYDTTGNNQFLNLATFQLLDDRLGNDDKPVTAVNVRFKGAISGEINTVTLTPQNAPQKYADMINSLFRGGPKINPEEVTFRSAVLGIITFGDAMIHEWQNRFDIDRATPLIPTNPTPPQKQGMFSAAV